MSLVGWDRGRGGSLYIEAKFIMGNGRIISLSPWPCPRQTWDLTVQESYPICAPAPPPPGMGQLYTGTPQLWHLVVKAGDLFKHVHLRTPQPPPLPACWHLMATEARTVGKRTVRILLECFLVSTAISEIWKSYFPKRTEILSTLRLQKNTNFFYFNRRFPTFKPLDRVSTLYLLCLLQNFHEQCTFKLAMNGNIVVLIENIKEEGMFQGCARFPEFVQNFSECQILWSLCSVDFHTFTLHLPIQTLHFVLPELQVFVSSLKNCQNFSKTSLPLVEIVSIDQK